MTSKNCTQCGELKPLTEFSKDKSRKDGFQCYCKCCCLARVISYRRTKSGKITRIYRNQVDHSKGRGHALPSYTVEELREWCFAQPIFHELYDKWIASGYSKMQSPSCDRLDDYKPYTFDNLRLVTWQENKDKSHEDRKNGFNNKSSRAVTQMRLDGTFVKEFYSASQAYRETRTSTGSISKCCCGKGKTANGFRWMFSLGIPIANNSMP